MRKISKFLFAMSLLFSLLFTLFLPEIFCEDREEIRAIMSREETLAAIGMEYGEKIDEEENFDNSDNPNDLKLDPLLEKSLEMRDEVNQPDIVVCANGESEPFLVDQDVTMFAYEEYKHLNESILFYPKFLKKTKQVRDFLRQPRHFNGKNVETNTTDGEKINYTYFDRNSDTLLVIGGALMNQERVASFVKMFSEYDVVIFNHRGVETKKGSVFNPSTWGYLVPSSCVSEGLNGKKVKLGQVEEKDVLAVVYDCWKRKTYRKVYGLALCYSAPIFIKAAVTRPKLFDKLILDGCWVSIDSILYNFAKTCGGKKASHWVHKILPTNKDWFISAYLWLGEKLSRIKYRSIKFDFKPFLRELKIPVLLIHGTDDVFISEDELRTVWKNISSDEKALILTTYNHIHNHLKRKELYKYWSDSFLELDYQDFLDSLRGTMVKPSVGV